MRGRVQARCRLQQGRADTQIACGDDGGMGRREEKVRVQRAMARRAVSSSACGRLPKLNIKPSAHCCSLLIGCPLRGHGHRSLVMSMSRSAASASPWSYTAAKQRGSFGHFMHCFGRATTLLAALEALIEAENSSQGDYRVTEVLEKPSAHDSLWDLTSRSKFKTLRYMVYFTDKSEGEECH